MSILRKAVLGLAVTVSVSGAAMAAPGNVLDFGGSTGTVTFTQGTGVLAASVAQVTITNPSGTAVVPYAGLFTFSANLVSGPTTNAFGTFADFSGGTFTFIYDGPSGGSLVQGSTEIAGGSFSSLKYASLVDGTYVIQANIQYDGNGFAQDDWEAINGSPLSGPLYGKMTFTGASNTSSNLASSFSSSINGSLTAAVPEPGEWAAMGILASGLTGLMVRSRRRRA